MYSFVNFDLYSDYFTYLMLINLSFLLQCPNCNVPSIIKSAILIMLVKVNSISLFLEEESLLEDSNPVK